MRATVHFAALLAVGYLAVCALMYFSQRSLQYVPDPRPVAPASVGLPQLAAETLTTDDGETLVVWWAAPASPDRPAYLYLHGNGANLAARDRRFAALTADGSGLLALSWRGYGGSTGRPTEPGLLADARAGYAELARRVPASRIVVFGESLGTTVALMLAAEVPVAAVVLDSSFASAQAVAESAYPWLPVGWLMHDTYRADRAAPRVEVPVLQVHCADDPVTPIAHAERLNALLPQARAIERIDARCHPAPFDRFEAALRGFVRPLTQGTAADLPPVR